MAITRRDFLAASAAASLSATALPRLWAAPDREISVKPAVVVLFLRGGQDALNTVVPHADGRYYDLRPNIAIPPPGEASGALDLDGTLGLHPALVGMKRLYDEGLLAPVVCAGSKHPSRSHFDCQDFLEYGAPGDKSVKSGWLNRYLEATSGPLGPEGEFRALGMQGRLPRSLRGTYPVLAVPNALGRGRQGGEDDVLDLFDPLYGMPGAEGAPPEMPEEAPEGDELVRAGRTTIETLRKLEAILSEPPAGKEVAYPPAAGRLGLQLKQAARVLKAGRGLEVVGIDWNGWDHHINQGGPSAQDVFWRMLAGLDAAVSAFFADVKTMRSQVTLLVMTEFGRTNAENGNRGTDHGHGSVMFVVGGKVKGGQVHGEWTTLAPGRTYQNRDLEVTTDFRTVLSEVLYGHLKLHPSKQLFPGFAGGAKLGLFA
jgi:uncharacterized protein (DUF1501 family)